MQTASCIMDIIVPILSYVLHVLMEEMPETFELGKPGFTRNKPINMVT